MDFCGSALDCSLNSCCRLLCEFLLVFLPSGKGTFGLSAILFAGHAFLDIFVIFLALFRVRTRKNVRNGAILALFMVLVVSGLWIAHIVLTDGSDEYCR